MQQAMIDPTSLQGGKVVSVPVVGQELIVQISSGWFNVGQVHAVEYEDGSGKGFNIRATRIRQYRPGQTVFVRLSNPSLAIPLQYA